MGEIAQTDHSGSRTDASRPGKATLVATGLFAAVAATGAVLDVGPGRPFWTLASGLGGVCFGWLAGRLSRSRDAHRAPAHPADLPRFVGENAGDIIWILDLETGQIPYVSPAVERILGFTPEEQMQRVGSFEMLERGGVAEAGELFGRALAGEIDSYSFEAEHVRKDGTPVWCEISMRFLRDAKGDARQAIGVTRDISERKAAEARLAESETQLRQAQRMETIGQLTAGIAHDVNNLLTVVVGNLELIEDSVKPEHEAMEYAIDARQASVRCSDLTRKLLSFSRRRLLRPRAVSASDLVRDLAPLLERTIGPACRIEVSSDDSGGWCRADPTELETAILNLAVNARDAMTRGGRLAIRVERCPAETGEEAGAAPNQRFIRILVEDDGEGMDEETIRRSTDPFFTTKAGSSGTGLGLSMVDGFAEQSGGRLRISSEVGRGTRVELRFPEVSPASSEQEETEQTSLPCLGGRGEQILIVDDEAGVRRVLTTMLAGLGYRSLAAADVDAALRLLERSPDVSLILSDVVMRGDRDGLELAGIVQSRWPELPVVLMSGFMRDAGRAPSPRGPIPLIEKPFTREELGQMIAATLNRN